MCAGDPRIKERMDLDVEVSRLKLMKADHQSKQYRLEDPVSYTHLCPCDGPIFGENRKDLRCRCGFGG